MRFCLALFIGAAVGFTSGGRGGAEILNSPDVGADDASAEPVVIDHSTACRWEAGPLQWFYLPDTSIDPKTLPAIAHLLPECPKETSPVGSGPSMEVEFFEGRMIECVIVRDGREGAAFEACPVFND
jgi:hypothetical protein